MIYVNTILLLLILISVTVNLNRIVDALKGTKTIEETKEVKPKKLLGTGRKGLMKRSFSSNDDEFDVVFEIYEIERSAKRSKIGILSQQTSKGKYATDAYKSHLKDMWDQAWVDDKDVEWLEESKELVREDKINNILD